MKNDYYYCCCCTRSGTAAVYQVIGTVTNMCVVFCKLNKNKQSISITDIVKNIRTCFICVEGLLYDTTKG